MFDRKMYSDMRRAGFSVGVSKNKIAQAMLEILLQLPSGTTNLKDTVIFHLGQLGQMTTTRDLNDVWNKTKKRAEKTNPEKFLLDGRNVLHWNDGTVKVLDKNISAANFKKLNELAETENCNVNTIVLKLIKNYKKQNC